MKMNVANSVCGTCAYVGWKDRVVDSHTTVGWWGEVFQPYVTVRDRYCAKHEHFVRDGDEACDDWVSRLGRYSDAYM